MIKTIPSQWWMCSLLFSKTTVSTPVKMTIVPLSIWNTLAYLHREKGMTS